MSDNKKITDLPELSNISDTDVLEVVTNMDTTPENVFITVLNFFKGLMKKTASSVISGNIPTFSGTNGNLLQDSGTKPADFAAAVHNHSGVYEPVDATILRQGNLAGTGAANTPARSDHNHTGTYQPAGSYAPAAQGVTNGDTHDHDGGDGAQINHTKLSNIGTNTHAQIDSHIGSSANPHAVTKAQVGLTNVTDDAQVKRTEMGSASGVATLGSDGKVPSAQLPAIAITDTFVVASEAAMLALTAEVGDIAIRSDLSKCFILQTADPSVLGHWLELATPPDAVTSVAGKTGNVTLASSDVGLGNVSNNAQIKKIAVAVDGNIVVFDGTGGADVKDSGTKPSDFAAVGHNHTGVYEPADATILKQGNLAGSGIATTPAKSDHDHSGVYQPVDATLTALAGLDTSTGVVEQTGTDTFSKHPIGTAANNIVALDANAKLPAVDGSQLTNLPSSGGGTTTIGTQRVWTDIFSVSRTDNDTITYTAASAALATVIANSIAGRLARWTDSGGSTVRKGFIRNATASDTTVTIELMGDVFAAGDTNFRLSMYETVKVADWYVPGEQVADSTNPVGKRYWNHTGQDWCILATSAYVNTAAAGTSADLTYDIYDDGTGIFTSDPSFTTNASVLNSLPNNRVISGGSQLTLRTPVSAGGTNKAGDLYVMAFYAFDDFWDAV